MNVPSVDGLVNTLLGVLAVPENATVPRNNPGLPCTAGSVYRLAFGCRTVNRSVENFTESLSVTTMTWTQGPGVHVGSPPGSFGSSTVISIASSHSYRFVRSAVMVAHCPPAGLPGELNRVQAGE